MKKTIYLATLLVLPVLAIAQTQLKIAADIRGRGCSGGLGLCSVSSTASLQKSTQTSPTTAIKQSETEITMEINYTLFSDTMQINLAGNLFSRIAIGTKLYFTQDEDLILDNDSLLVLGINPKFKYIKKGIYPMFLNKDTVTISIVLTEN